MSSKKRIYDFGPYRLDPVKRQLLREGEPVALTPKAFDILLRLVEAGEQGLERNDLIAHVWPDSFVEENILTVNISTLRKVLGEQRGENRYITTIPGKGYRFVADVHELWDDSELEGVERTRERVVIKQEEVSLFEQTKSLKSLVRTLLSRISAMSVRRLSLRRALLATGVFLFCLLAAGLIWRYAVNPPPRANTDWRDALQFIRVAGLKSDRKETLNSGRLSPNGNLIVFSATGEGMNLWLRQIGGGQPMQITRGPWHDDSPIWSPGGDRIAFMSDRNHELGIWIVPFIGGEPPTLLKSLEPGGTLSKSGTGLRHWSRNGTTIYFSWQNNVFALDVASKEMTQLTNFDSEVLFNREFRISSDEEWIAYVDKQGEQFDIWRVPTRGGTPTRVTDDPAREHGPVWSLDGKRIIYSARVEGRFRLYQVHLDNPVPELITFTEDESYIWDISADGTKLLYYGRRDESDVWRSNLDTNEETQLTFDIGPEFWPQVSPDGRAMLFQALQGEKLVWEPKKSSLLVSEVATAGQAIEIATSAYGAQWSPDGQKIAFLRDATGLSNLFIVQAVGGEEKSLTNGGVIFGGFTIGPPFNQYCTKDFCWSPDSRKIAYCSKKDGAPNLWVISTDGSGETKLSNNTDPSVYYSCPMWSPDGRHIAYVTNTGGQPGEGNASWTLWVTNLETSESIVNSAAIIRLLGWNPSSSEVVMAAVANQGMNRAFPAEVTLSRLSIAGRNQQDFAHVESTYFANIQLSPDGRNVSFVGTYDGRDEIWVLPVEGGEKRKITSNSDSKSYYSGLAWSPDGKQIYYGKQACWNLINVIDNFK